MLKQIASRNEPLPDLTANFQVRRGLFRKERIVASLFDFDQYGCVIKTDKIFNPGDNLTLTLVMEMPFEDIRVESLSGLVTERQKHCSNFFYSIDFIGNDTQIRATASDKLDRIQAVLMKKLTLRSRRNRPSSSSASQSA